MSGQSQPAAAKPRYVLLDVFRGLCVLSMVCYHAMYDLYYIKGIPISWYPDTPGYLWQQSICWGFILLSGFCWGLSRRPLRHGLILTGCGAVVTLATYFIMPSELIQYGVLTLLGLSALLLIPLDMLCKRLHFPAWAGLLCAGLLFFLTRDLPQGYLGFEGLRLAQLPAVLYSSDVPAVLGFSSPTFYSCDYFPLLPWFFLYACGYFLWKAPSWQESALKFLRSDFSLLRPFAFLGRRSLLIYLLHQPILLGIFQLILI